MLESMIDPDSSWAVADDHAKVGLVPIPLSAPRWRDQKLSDQTIIQEAGGDDLSGAKFTITLQKLTQAVDLVVIIYMQSHSMFIDAVVVIEALVGEEHRGSIRMNASATKYSVS